MLREVALTPFRKIGKNNIKLEQGDISASDLCYQLDIDLDCEKQHAPYIDTHPYLLVDSAASAIEHVQQAMTYGLTNFNLHITCSKTNCIKEKVNKTAQFICNIRNQFVHDIVLLIDLVGMAFHPDLSWGVKKNNKINAVETLKLLEQMGAAYTVAGADEILTIGRINYEVEAVKSGIAQVDNSTTRVASFSTNSAMVMSYFDPWYADPDRSQVEQLLCPVNIDEMIVRALLDIVEGSHTIYQKPITHTHVTERLRTLLENPTLLEKFITSQVELYGADNPSMQRLQTILEYQDFDDIALGGYSVSGDSFNVLDIAKNYNDYFAYKYLRERYLLFKQVSGSHFKNIIDRNALWFLIQQDSKG